MLYPYPGYCGTGVHNLHKFRYECRTELTEVPGTGMIVYRTCRSSGTGNTRENTPGVVMYV